MFFIKGLKPRLYSYSLRPFNCTFALKALFVFFCSIKWSCAGNWEETEVHTVRWTERTQSWTNNQTHRHGVQWNGSWLQVLKKFIIYNQMKCFSWLLEWPSLRNDLSWQGAGQKSKKAGSAVFPGVPRANPHRPAGTESGFCYARIHTVRVCYFFFFKYHIQL